MQLVEWRVHACIKEMKDMKQSYSESAIIEMLKDLPHYLDDQIDKLQVAMRNVVKMHAARKDE